jgi:hypothetical protein
MSRPVAKAPLICGCPPPARDLLCGVAPDHQPAPGSRNQSSQVPVQRLGLQGHGSPQYQVESLLGVIRACSMCMYCVEHTYAPRLAAYGDSHFWPSEPLRPTGIKEEVRVVGDAACRSWWWWGSRYGSHTITAGLRAQKYARRVEIQWALVGRGTCVSTMRGTKRGLTRIGGCTGTRFPLADATVGPSFTIE